MTTNLFNQKGSMSIVTLFTLAMVIIGSVFLFYFFTAFVEKRQAQNIADASALAAAQVLRDKFEEAMMKKTDETMNRFLDTTIPSEYAKLTEDPKPEFDEFTQRFIDTNIRTDELKQKLLSKSYRNDEDWLLVVKEPYFQSEYGAQQNGDTLYQAFVQNGQWIEDAARTAAELNHGKPTGTITFPDEGKPKLLVEAARTIRIDNIGLEKDITTVAAAGVDSKDFEIDVSGKTPREVRW
jgi:hypothetical protein